MQCGRQAQLNFSFQLCLDFSWTANYLARLKKEKGLVFFNVKARVKVDERQKVTTYYGYENLTDGTIEMSDHKIDVHDPLLPDVYRDLVKFTDDFCETFGIR